MGEQMLLHRSELKKVPLFRHGEFGEEAAEPILAVAKDGARIAVSSQSPGSVLHWIEMQDGQSAVLSATFEPEESDGEITTCCWDPEGTKLAVGTTTGEVWLFSEGFEVRERCLQAWGRVGLVSVLFLATQKLLVVTRLGRAYIVDTSMDPNAREVANLRAYHMVVNAVVAGQNETFVAVGNERDDGESSAERLKDNDGITVSVWKLTNANATMQCSLGNKPTRGLFSSLWKTLMPPLTSCKMSVSPNGDHVAIASGGGPLKIFSIKEQRFVPHGELEGEASSVITAVQDVEWWSLSTLVVVSGIGNVVFLTFPGFKTMTYEEYPESPKISVSHTTAGPFMFAFGPVLSNGRRFWGGCLDSIINCTPSEMVDVMMGKGMEEEALRLSEIHDLNTDKIYASLWSINPVNEANLKKNLNRVQDRKWVVGQCIQRLALDCPEEKLLLDYGLKETAKHSKLAQEEKKSEHAWYLEHHMKILGCLDRLETFLEIHKGGYNDEAFASFRDSGISSIAMAYASSGNTEALQVLQKRHTFTTCRDALTILSQIPETLDCHKWISLLPKPGTSLSQLYQSHREQDPLETLDTLAMLNLGDVHGVLQITETLESLRIQDSFPFSMQDISDWCVERAFTMDVATGQLSNSKSFLDLAVEEGVIGGISSVLQDVTVLSAALREDDHLWNMRLTDFSGMELDHKIDMVLKESSDVTIEHDIREKLVPLMEGLTRKVQQEVLLGFLKKEFETRAPWVVKLAEYELEQGLLFGTDSTGMTDYCHLVLSLVKVISDVDKWEELTGLMLLADTSVGLLAHRSSDLTEVHKEPQSVQPYEGDSGSELMELRSSISTISKAVQAGSILSHYGVLLPLQKLDNIDDESALTIIRSMLSRASRGGKNWSHAEWKTLWENLRALSDSLLTVVDEQTVLAEYCRALLRTGKSSVAKEYLLGEHNAKMDKGTAEELVLSVGREFLYSAASITDEAIQDGRNCFELVPEVEAAQAELHMLDALLQLPNFGFTLLPIQLKQLPNRIDVIPYLLKGQPGNYKDLESLRSIAKLLGLNTHEDHLEVDLMIGQAALESQDYEVAEEVANGLMRGGLKKAWRLCASLAQDAGDHIQNAQKQNLLAFAVANCPEENLTSMVDKLLLASEEKNSELQHPVPAEERLHMALMMSPSPVPLNMNALSMGDSSLALHVLLSNPDLIGLKRNCPSYLYFQRAHALNIIARLTSSRLGNTPVPDLLSLSTAELFVLTSPENSPTHSKDLESAHTALSETRAAKSARLMKSIMPGVDVMRFASGDSNYRGQLILEEAAYAGEILALPEASESMSQTALKQATELAQGYGVESPAVASAFIVSAIVFAPEITPTIKALLTKEETKALEAPGQFVTALWEGAWGEVFGDDGKRLSCFLHLIDDGLVAEGQSSSLLHSVAELVERHCDDLQGFNFKAVLEDSIMGMMGLDATTNEENTAIQEIFRYVSLKNAIKLASMVDEFAAITNTPSTVTSSKVYMCMVVKEMNAAPWINNAEALPESSLESKNFWEEKFQAMEGNDICAFLLWCCLNGPEPLGPEVSLPSTVEAPSDVKIAALTAGIPNLQQDTSVATSSVKSLDQEIRRLSALDSAQRLAGMTSCEFQSLLQDDSGASSQKTIENVIRQLLDSGSKVDVVLEVASSVAKTKDGEPEQSVPEQVLEFLLEEVKTALESIVNSRASAYSTVYGVVECLNLNFASLNAAVASYLQSARASIWAVLSDYCLIADGDILDVDGVIQLLELCEALSKGQIWEQWSCTDSSVVSVLQAKIIFSQTQPLVETSSSVSYTWENFRSVGSCQAMFSNILATFSGHLSTLADVLSTIWSHGLFLVPPEDVGGGVGVVPLHACWSELLLAMINQNEMAHLISSVDVVRAETWVPPDNTSSEPCAMLCLLTLPEAEELVQALKSPECAICVALMMPYEDVRKAAIKQIAANGCNGAILALLLESGSLSSVLNEPIISSCLCTPLMSTPPHPEVIEFWDECQEKREEQPSMEMQDPREEESGVPKRGGISKVEYDHMESTNDLRSSGDGWQGTWNDFDADESQSEEIIPQAGGSAELDAVHLQGTQQSVNGVNIEDALEGGWGDEDDDWAEALREAQELTAVREHQPHSMSPPRGEDSVDAELSDGDGWRNSGSDDDWNATVREAAALASGGNEEQIQGSLPSGSAAVERVALEGLEPGMGDPGSGNEEGWGEDCEWSETLKAAEQMAGDPPQHEFQGLHGDSGNPPGIDATSVDGWDDDDDELGELLRVNEGPSDAQPSTSSAVADPSSTVVKGQYEGGKAVKGGEATGSDNPPCAVNQHENSGDISRGNSMRPSCHDNHVQSPGGSQSPIKKQDAMEDWEGSELLYSTLLPIMVSSLCNLNQFGLASSIICQRLKLHSAMITPDAGMAFLVKYLKTAVSAAMDLPAYEHALNYSTMPYTSRRLLERLPKDCMEALTQLQALSDH